MVRASQRTGLFDRLSAILLLPPEMLLRVAIRFESANRIVFPNGRDQDVAFEYGAISGGRPASMSFAGWPWLINKEGPALGRRNGVDSILVCRRPHGRPQVTE